MLILLPPQALKEYVRATANGVIVLKEIPSDLQVAYMDYLCDFKELQAKCSLKTITL